MSFDHKRNLNLKYEDMEDDYRYSITLNPEDAYQFWDMPDRLALFEKHHLNHLKKLAIHDRINVCVFDLHLELSPAGRLHYHGYLRMLNKKTFYLYTLHKLAKQYQYEIDVINDPQVWDDYVNKQWLGGIVAGNDFKQMTKDFYTKQSGNQENL